jgi:hypothetical protein
MPVPDSSDRHHLIIQLTQPKGLGADSGERAAPRMPVVTFKRSKRAPTGQSAPVTANCGFRLAE